MRHISGNLPLSLNRTLGPIWAAGEPQLEHLIQTRAWGERLHAQILACTNGILQETEQLKSFLATLFNSGVASFASGTSTGILMNSFRDGIAEADPLIDQLIGDLGWNRKKLEASPNFLNTIQSACHGILSLGPHIRHINEDLVKIEAFAKEALSGVWENGEPSAETLRRVKAWGEKIHLQIASACNYDVQTINKVKHAIGALFAEGMIVFSEGSSMHELLANYQKSYNGLYNSFLEFADLVRLDRHYYETSPDFVGAVIALTSNLPAHWSKAHAWSLWQRARQEGVTCCLGALTEEAIKREDPSVDLLSLFEKSFRRALFFSIMEIEKSLREFIGHEHSQKIKDFCNLDDKVAALSRELIRLKLAQGIPTNKSADEVPKEELGLLRKEIGKKTRHIPVRQLLGRIPNLMARLKPCVLMSPLSVAQYLEPGHTQFDVVIFDEASQIPVWDAVGAIARGKQLIVVGDPKQLPPTNFFNAQDDEDDESPELNIQKDLESILDELLTLGLRHRRLKWHYRSRHEGLIAFSNKHYYENDLLTFPSALKEGGVSLRHLPGARYDKGQSRTNLIEAKALVEELVKRLCNEETSRSSYGVVTFNQAQQDLIENLLDEERRKHPEVEEHFGETPPVEGEPVFVKNLENVQGDERDVILFSICYGMDEAGRMSMNFGPLNKQGGHRRLNVAITRAKQEVIVFSGIRGDHIDLRRTNARGARDLKYFLEYAERGPKALISELSLSSSAEAESELEQMVAERIKEMGFEVHHQVGCSGYRIDLGIVDPNAPGKYLLGVECDGATYHRSATARDRDKLRQMILEGLGWKMHRIWSTDWWHDAEREMEKLLKVISSISS